MPVELSSVSEDELAALSALCLRSKAHWGYDAEFMAACRAELTVSAADLTDSAVIAARVDGALAGMVQVICDGAEAEIWKLFVDPERMGRGVGRRLFGWCAEEARRRGAGHLRIEADPDAVPFYRRMGARVVGSVPSGSIPGRSLPLMRLTLREPASPAPTAAKAGAARPR